MLRTIIPEPTTRISEFRRLYGSAGEQGGAASKTNKSFRLQTRNSDPFYGSEFVLA
jgi:hypothetical protein